MTEDPGTPGGDRGPDGPDDDGSGAVPVFRLMYRSRSLLAPDDRRRELGRIFSVARPANKAAGITGALLLTQEWFVQVLEGDERRVRSLYRRITRDPRHHDVELLSAGPVPARVFARWAMAEVGDRAEADVPLIAGQRGAVPAAPRATTADQESVLDLMRDAARQGAVSA